MSAEDPRACGKRRKRECARACVRACKGASLTHLLTRTHTHTHSLTRTHTHTHSLTRTHAHTHTLSLCLRTKLVEGWGVIATHATSCSGGCLGGARGGGSWLSCCGRVCRGLARGGCCWWTVCGGCWREAGGCGLIVLAEAAEVVRATEAVAWTRVARAAAEDEGAVGTLRGRQCTAGGVWRHSGVPARARRRGCV